MQPGGRWKQKYQKYDVVFISVYRFPRFLKFWIVGDTLYLIGNKFTASMVFMNPTFCFSFLLWHFMRFKCSFTLFTVLLVPCYVFFIVLLLLVILLK